MDPLHAKAQTIAEILPHLRAVEGNLLVLKYGGSVIEEAVYAESILHDVAFLRHAGMSVVIVHGGGKAISNKMREQGITPKFVNGLRYTDKKTISIVESVLTHAINPPIVEGLRAKGAKADGLSGKKVLSARKMTAPSPEGKGKVDLGFVGEVTRVATAKLHALIKKGVVPVVTPVAAGPGGASLNINADLAAARVAADLRATHLVFLSDVNGILEDPQHPDSTLAKVSQNDIAGLCNTGVISGGMLPKVTASLDALKKGVRRVKFLNGQFAHCLLADFFLEPKMGTEIVL
jgi:acetylglutamate kinase